MVMWKRQLVRYRFSAFSNPIYFVVGKLEIQYIRECGFHPQRQFLLHPLSLHLKKLMFSAHSEAISACLPTFLFNF